PTVSRDGKWLVYTDNRAGPTALVAREMATSEEAAVRFDRMDHRRPTGSLRLIVKDTASGKPTIARISLKEDKGRYPSPPRPQPTRRSASLAAWPRALLLRPDG